MKITDENSILLPNGSFNISAQEIARAQLYNIIGDLPQKILGVFGHFEYATNLSHGSALSKILDLLEIKSSQHASNNNIWLGPPEGQKPVEFNLINGGFKDSSKSAIDVAHRKVFGRGICISPNEIDPNTSYVLKSETQAAHDGRVVLGAEIISNDFSSSVVQRLIDNRISESVVRDIRVPYIGGEIPFAYIKTRPISHRFSNANKSTCVTAVKNVLSDSEIFQIKNFCQYLKLDYGELDVLRDVQDGAIWIVDVNNGPSGPPNGLTKGEADFAVREMAISFFRSFL